MTVISNGNYYVPRTKEDAEKGFWIASAASGAIMSTLPLFSKPFLKQMKAEHANNQQYKDAFIKSFKTSGLPEEGVNIIHQEFSPDDLAKLGTAREKEIFHKDVKAGLNAFYAPDAKEIHFNLNKASISAFHEAGHALNNLKSTWGNLLQKFRGPGYAIAGLMGTVALFSRPKPKENDNGLRDFVQNNCGKIAFAAMLPTVAEEALASHKGIKLAREGGLGEAAIKNLKKFYGKALMSYAGYAIATGLSVGLANKIMQHYTRPKEVSPQQEFPQGYYPYQRF